VTTICGSVLARVSAAVTPGRPTRRRGRS
jgi:hypothetical protein